jgi:outer membrane autotransporter protein
VHTSLAIASDPTHGTTSVAGDVITYTSAAGYFGADSFTYTATGPGGTSAPATVMVTVATPVAPTVAAASAAVAYDSTGQTIPLTASGVYTTLAVATAPAHGTATISGTTATYVPAAGYFGVDSFTYTATGPGGTSAPATVTVTVATPAPPVIEQPSAPVVVTPPSGSGGSSPISVELKPTSQGVIEGYRITVVSQFGVAEIIDGASTARAQSAGSVGARATPIYRLVYTPVANFMGEDTVTLVAYGPGGDSAPVTFTFQAAGKAPDLSGEMTSGTAMTFAPTAGLVGGPFQALRITRAPAFGTATVNGLSIVFTPGSNGGATSLDYVIDLAFGASAPGRIDLTANALPGPETLVAQTLQGVPVTVRISNVAGGPFIGAAVVSMAPATAGKATIAKVGDDYDLTFVSTGDFAGEAMVNYSLTNAFGTTNSTLIVTVEARPDPSLNPEVRGVATSQVTSARRFADAQINNFQQRLRDLHDGANGSSNGLSLNLGMGSADKDRDPQQALRRQLGQDRSLNPGALGGDRDREMLGLDIWAGRAQAAVPVGASDDRLNAAAQPAVGVGSSVGLWTSGSVDWGRQDATGQRDSRFTTQGATVGLDVKVSDQLIVGGGVGYGEDKTRIGDNGSVTHGKAVTGALYASWRPAEAFYVDGVLGYANLDFTSRRWVEGLAGQADGYADGDRSGDVRFASAAFGRVLRGERLTSDFYARLDARDITLDGFTETGGGLSALDWDEIEQKSLSANLGASWRWTLDSRRYGRFVPTARVEWSHELEDIGAQGVRYADWTASPTYLVPLNAWSRNAINLNLGTEWSLSDRLMFSLGYRGALGDASTSHGAQIGMKYGW